MYTRNYLRPGIPIGYKKTQNNGQNQINSNNYVLPELGPRTT